MGRVDHDHRGARHCGKHALARAIETERAQPRFDHPVALGLAKLLLDFLFAHPMARVDKPGGLRTIRRRNTIVSLALGFFVVICPGHWVTGQEGLKRLPTKGQGNKKMLTQKKIDSLLREPPPKRTET